jgi:hypothetical protein
MNAADAIEGEIDSGGCVNIRIKNYVGTDIEIFLRKSSKFCNFPGFSSRKLVSYLEVSRRVKKNKKGPRVAP